jgi:enoyl-CoA hydratase/carnithine racemase
MSVEEIRQPGPIGAEGNALEGVSPVFDEVVLECVDGVATIMLNRPDRLNAFSVAGLIRLAELLGAAERDPAVRVVLVTGTGRMFSAGADIGDGSEPTPVALDAANEVIRAVRRIPKPVVAAVNGPAVGFGCSLALAADIVLAKESAYFLLAFADVGLMPDGGATAMLPAAVGWARAMRMALLPERLAAATALEWGLIAATASSADYDAQVEQLVARLAAGPTAAYAEIKRAIDAGALAGLPAALDRERAGQARLITTTDYREGVLAFRGKRVPRFSGA